MSSLWMVAAVAFAGGDQLIATPSTWLREPTPSEIATAAPSNARGAIAGRAAIYCRVETAGTLTDCQVQSEKPFGVGLGAAALKLAPDFQLAPTARNEAAFVVIPIDFREGGAAIRRRTEAATITNPVWDAAPSFADVAAVYPARAAGASGSVSLLCQFHDNGLLSRCEATRETPGGLGFADAAKALSAKFKVRVDPNWAMGGNAYAVEFPVALSNPNSPDVSLRRIGQPNWTVRPTPAAVAEVFPKDAAAKGVASGRGVAECRVDAQGGLNDCKPLAADPENLGFSEAAVKVASGMKMSPWTLQGGSVDGAIVRVPIRLTVDDSIGAEARARIWSAPTDREMLAAIPRQALAKGVGGHADLRCRPMAGGEVRDCAVVSETPAGWGFGVAALQLAPKYRVATVGGAAPSWVLVPVDLNVMSH